MTSRRWRWHLLRGLNEDVKVQQAKDLRVYLSRFIFYLKNDNCTCQDIRKFHIKHSHRWTAHSFHMWDVPENLVLFEKLQADYHCMQVFSHFRKNTSYDLHKWRQYCHLLEYIPSLVYLDHPGPSISPSWWRMFCLEKFLHVKVPHVKTAFVNQGLGKRKFVKTMEVSTSASAPLKWRL